MPLAARGASTQMPQAQTSGLTLSKSVGPRLLRTPTMSGEHILKSPGGGNVCHGAADHFNGISGRSLPDAPQEMTFFAVAGVPMDLNTYRPCSTAPLFPAATATSTSSFS